MAEDLDDGEFWLPSHFLTDDDILMDFDFKHGSASASDLDFTSSGCTETESDEDDILLAGLTHQMTRSNLHDSSCPIHSSKGWVLSSSPQSTLYGCMCNQSSSRESGSVSVSPPPKQPPREAEDKNDAASVTTVDGEVEKNDKATLDLLNKAAGEVARLKMRSEKKSSSIGTGFFDCSQKGVSYPPPLSKNLDQFPPLYFQPHFLHFPPPPMIWAPSNGIHQYNQPKQQPPQNRATKNNTKNNNKSNNTTTNNKSNNTTTNSSNNNRPLGLPPSAWPPLQAQPPAQVPAQAQPPAQVPAKAQPIQPAFVAPKSTSVGTGVFLPRRVATLATDTRKKSDANAAKAKTGKGSQSQSNNRRNSGKTSTTTTKTTTTTVNHNDIQLPQEWTY